MCSTILTAEPEVLCSIVAQPSSEFPDGLMNHPVLFSKLRDVTEY
jgi:hypothetical protein